MDNEIIKTAEDRAKNVTSSKQAFHPEAISFWDCQTKEDRIARNLWLCFIMGILAFSCLLLTLSKANIINSLLGLA